MLKTVGFPSTRTGDQTILNGNLVIGTAGKGIDFSADPSAPGMTSELLDDYEEGTWTPVDASGAGLTFSGASGYYTKTGNIVTAMGTLTFPATASALGLSIGGLPFAVASNNQPGGGFIRLTNAGRSDNMVAAGGTAELRLYSNVLSQATNADYSTDRIDFVVEYMA